jgi:hypothetical protein
MDQRSIVLYLHLKVLLANVIHDSLVATLGPKAAAYSTMKRHVREAKLGTAGYLDSTGRKAVFVCAEVCPSHPYPMGYHL